MNTTLKFDGSLISRKRKNNSVPFAWKIKQYSRLDFLLGVISSWLAKSLSKFTGIPVLIGELRIKKNGVDYGLVSSRVVTTAFVNYMVDQLQSEDSSFGDFKYHDSGVGTTASTVADTDIETTDGVARVVGTQEEGASANIYRSVGIVTYSSSLAITEHGLFNASTSGTLLDRHVFTAINVESSDSIEFTYDLTCSAGG